MKSLCVIPVYNQVSELPGLIEKLKQGTPASDVLFVNDGSSDHSLALIQESGFSYLNFEKRMGVGHALIRGAEYGLKNNFEVVIHLAGNGKMLPSEMHRVLDPIVEGKADYVWGSRFMKGGQFLNAPLFRKLAIPYGFNLLPLLFYGVRVTDATCGYRAYRLSILKEHMPGWNSPWLYGYEFEYFVLAKVFEANLSFQEVPISMVYPSTKKSYSKIIPIISWWPMIKPWVILGLGMERLFYPQQLAHADIHP